MNLQVIARIEAQALSLLYTLAADKEMGVKMVRIALQSRTSAEGANRSAERAVTSA